MSLVFAPGPRVHAVDLDDPNDRTHWVRLLGEYDAASGALLPLGESAREATAKELTLWPGFYSWMHWQNRKGVGVINCFIGYDTRRGRSIFRVQDLFVAPPFRSKGIGRALLLRAEEEARLLRCAAIVVAAPQSTAAGSQFAALHYCVCFASTGAERGSDPLVVFHKEISS